MNTGESHTRHPQQTLDEACQWFIDCQQGKLDPEACRRFDRWLRNAPEHVRAYLEIAAAWEESGRLEAGPPIGSRTLDVASGPREGNVVPLEPAPGKQVSAGKGNRMARWLVPAAAALVLLAIGVGSLSRHPAHDGHAYETGVGEEQTIALNDGSTVQLDARSSLRVSFSPGERRVELLYGQALFRVKKNIARPFIVLGNGVRVRDVGTQFDVDRMGLATTITVIEGRVAVSWTPRSTSREPGIRGGTESTLLLAAGEKVTVAPRTVPRVTGADLAATTAWTRGRLVFEETPLSDVAAEFNRYNSRQMIIEDAALASYHITGAFDAHDPRPFLQFLRARFDADVRERGNEIRISRN